MLVRNKQNTSPKPPVMPLIWQEAAISLPIIVALVAPPAHEFIRQKISGSQDNNPLMFVFDFFDNINIFSSDKVEVVDETEHSENSDAEASDDAAPPSDEGAGISESANKSQATQPAEDLESIRNNQSLTKEQTVTLIDSWLQSKNRVFTSSSSEETLLESVFADSPFHKRVKAGMAVLENSESYYEFQSLQVRTKVLDGDWRETFERWYPELVAQAA